MIEEKHKDCQIPTDNDSVVDNYSPKNYSKIINCPENFLLFTLSQGEFVLKNKWGLSEWGSSLSHNFFPKKFSKKFLQVLFLQKKKSFKLFTLKGFSIYICTEQEN